MLNFTASEFKAWFDGFSCTIKETPTKEQWELLKKKMEEIKVSNYTAYPLTTRDTLSPPFDITCKTSDSSNLSTSSF